MCNGRVNRRTIAVTIATIILITATTTSMATTGNALASSRNQATGAANDCGNGQIPTNIGCQNSDSQIQGDENSVAISSQHIFPSVTREPPSPPTPTGFTVTGSGTGITLTCPQGEFPGQPFSVQFSAQSDGTTTSGTYTISFTDSSGERVIREGVLTAGSTDGNTFSLGGIDNVSLCGDPDGGLPTDVAAGVGGDCGDNVTNLLYSDFWTVLTLTGNVECMLK
jgi:hypothetical protein